jgi:hypothetical protein
MSNIKSRKYYEDYSIEEISRIPNPFRFLTFETQTKTPVEDQLKATDDELRSNTWSHLYKTAAFHFDNPPLSSRERILSQIRFDYGNLLSEASNELPLVFNRRALLNWVCNKNNQYLENKGSSKRVVCDIDSLLQVYGPSVEAAEKYLGSYKEFV